ncbi:MAG: ABC transporter permease [Bergeyella sp.]|nr:ABC transporter permease [Bergeyella sp.]
MRIYLKLKIMNSWVILLKSIKYQILIYLRIRQAVFFSLVFPVFLFIIFGNIWGASPDYIPFLLSGIIGMSIASEGLFAIGTVIREYYTNGLIKYFRKLPFNILLHFAGLIVSRIMSLLFTLLILCIISYLFFGSKPSANDFIHYTIGTIIGLSIFSFIGLCLSFSGIKGGADKGLSNLIYFIMLFTSMAFYPVKSFNKTIGTIGDYLPLNPVLNILRNEAVNYPVLLFWLLFPMFIFYMIFGRIKFSR